VTGRAATTDHRPGRYALAVGRPKMPSPPGWVWVELQQIARLESGHTPSRNYPSYWNGDIPWIGIKDARLHHGRRIFETLQTVSQEGLENSAARLLPEGTVCLSRTASVGYAVVMGESMATSQDFVNWVCSEAIEPEFLMYLFIAEKESLRSFGKGTTHTTIYYPEVKAFHVCLPPRPEQHRIVEAIESYFTRLDDAVATLERVQRNLKRYRASVLKAAVEGRLVPTEAELARAEGRDLPAPRPGRFFVYAIECDGGSHYIGQTDDLRRRWKEHLAGTAADWTETHRPCLIAHYEEFDSREAAVKREKELKTGFGRKWLKREIAAGRARQAGYEPASVLLDRILAERRRRWEEAELAKIKAKGKTPKDDTWKKKYKEPESPDTEGLPELPKGWLWASIDQLGEVSGGLTQNSKRSVLSKQIPFLRVANVYANELRLDEVKTIGLQESEFERVRLARGDLLVVEGNGSLDQIGRVALWDGSIDPCVHQNHLIKVRFSPVGLGEWSIVWLMAPRGRAAIERAASSTSGLHTLSLTKVKGLPIPLPPAGEQVRITAEVDRLLTIAAATAEEARRSSARCSRLRQAILKWAFEGRLVDQDPSDEPASVLLDRIRAEREGARDERFQSRGRRTATRRTAGRRRSG
jgi:predicted GIY-YIG superfamily endonuclease/restriction endonuclease S subunit